MSQTAVLHSFWASSCSWRVRAALQHKQLEYCERAVDILSGRRHLTEQFRRLHPAQKVPALKIDGVVLVESMAILQYLEETRPQPPLLPTDPLPRARVREIVETIVSGIQPLQNVGLQATFSEKDSYERFARHHTLRGLRTLEDLLARGSGDYCVGDALSHADLCLVPQIYNAVSRLKLDITEYARVSSLYGKLSSEKLFVDTHPLRLRPTGKIKV